MTTIVGRNCKVEVALTFGTPVTAGATAITKAAPAVVTDAAHGLLDGAVGFWTITSGMIELNEQAFMVDNKATDTWEMPGFETTDYSTFVSADSTYTMAATWGTISEAAGYSVGGGAANQLDDTRLTDTKTRNIAGLLAPQDVSIDVKSGEIDGAAMLYIAQKARAAAPVLFKISKGSQVLRVFYGVPSLPGEAAQAGALATGQFSVTVPGWVIKPNV
jgi:hypothetical protein